MTRTTTLALAAAGLTFPGVAHACGGFFCNQAAPIDQAGEEILFAVDELAGTTEMHVKVEYEGPASEFSWVVPVAGQPELGVGTEVLFEVLRGYGSQWVLQYESVGDCWDYGSSSWSFGTGTGTGTGTGGGGYSTTAPSGVTIVDRGVVGPYETVTLTATDSGALIAWLESNNYDLPPGFDAVIAPYVAGGSHFVGLKLTKDADTGDLAPLVLTYEGTTPSIPIQLTSVAATPDMPLSVYVLGEHRAVPESYLHIQMNHLAVDWWRQTWSVTATGWNGDPGSWGLGLQLAIRAATDEAGGHGFITDFAGSPASIDLVASSWDLQTLGQSADAYEFLTEIIAQAWPADDVLLEILNTHVPVPAGLNVSDIDLYNCPSCYETELRAAPFDAVAAVADLDARIYQPRVDAEALLDSHAVLTRMTSTLSPVEMTVDPVFVFNPDMPLRPRERVATEVTICDDGVAYNDSPRQLELEDGRVVYLPSRQDLWDLGLSEHEYLLELTTPAAAVVERTGASGQPEILVDNRDQMARDVQTWNIGQVAEGNWVGQRGDETSADARTGGCGCDTPGRAPSGLLLVLAGLVFGRRR